MSNLISGSISKDTANQYNRVWKDLQEFCTNVLKRHFSASEENIALYISHLDLKNLQPSTIQSHLSAISFLSQMNNMQDHTGSFNVEKIMKSLHKKSHTTDTRLPINQNLLNSIIYITATQCDSVYESALYRAMFSLSYYALLRVGECTQSKHVLTTNNVKRILTAGSCQAITIQFSSFKNSSNKNSAPPVLEIQRRGGESCPVKIISHYLLVRHAGEGPIFVNFSGKPITSKQFRDKLKLCASFLSLDVPRFNTHSFRIGRATDMLDEGYTEAQIRAAGRWQSRAFMKYLRPRNIML